ncbi:MAG TPA: hypothetical protein VE644_01095 [Gaiellaceae bacterium]|jgi:uncharacterized membrane protein|nr:hypothetical protein [Gaiellaceae bacterium]
MQLPTAVQQNPNAIVATLAGSLTIILVWIVSAAGVEMPAEVASAFTTAIAALLLLVGRKRPSTAAAPTVSAAADLT